MAEKEQFTFSGAGDDYGILATDKVAAEDAMDFLNGDETITKIDKNKPKEEPAKTDPKKTPEKKQDQSKKAPDKKEGDEEVKEEDQKPTNEEILKLLSDTGDDKEEDNSDESNKDDKKEGDEEESEDEEDEEENTFATLSKELVSLGVFTKEEEEDDNSVIANTPEEFAQRFQLEQKRGAIKILDNFLSQKGEEYREMFDTVFVKGVNPQDYLQRYARIQSIQGLDISKPDDQERIVRENLKVQGYKPDAVEAKLQKMVQYGDLEDEAKLAQEILLKREKELGDAQVVQKQQEINARNQQKAQFVNNVSKILTDKVKAKEFDGIPVDMKSANSVGHYLTAEKYTTNDGKTLTQFDMDILDLNKPENHAEKVKLGLIMQLLKEDPTLSKIQKKAISKETNSLFSKLEKDKGKKDNKNKEGKKSPSGEKVASWF